MLLSVNLKIALLKLIYKDSLKDIKEFCFEMDSPNAATV